MTVGLNKNGRLNSNKDIEGFLETLYSFTDISPCAVSILRVLSRGEDYLFKNTFKWRSQFDYSDIRIKQAVKEIEDKGFILSKEKRGYYELNKSIFIKEDVKRISIIFENGKIQIDYEAK